MNDDNDDDLYGGTCRLCGEPVGDEDFLFDTQEQPGGPMHDRCAAERDAALLTEPPSP